MSTPVEKRILRYLCEARTTRAVAKRLKVCRQYARVYLVRLLERGVIVRYNTSPLTWER